MRDLFEQWTTTMEKMWEPWKQMAKDAPMLQKPEFPFHGSWSAWIAAMRSTSEVNAAWWQTFMDQGEGLFFKMFRESPLHNQAIEDQMRESWQIIRNAQQTQHDLIKQQFQKMESMLKEREES